MNSKDGVFLCHVAGPFEPRDSGPPGKPEDFRSGACPPMADFQGLAVADDSFTLDALALKPSDFCNSKVYPALNESNFIIIVLIG